MTIIGHTFSNEQCILDIIHVLIGPLPLLP